MARALFVAAARVGVPAPIVVIATSWLGGALLLHALPRLPSAAADVAVVLVALAAWRSAATRWLAFAAAGFVWTAVAAEVRLADRLPVASTGQDFAVRGWIDSFPTAAPGQVTFSLTVTQPRAAGVPRRVRLTWYDPPLALAAGQSLDLVARLRAPHGARNPGGFDYERWLMVSGHGATGYVRSGRIASGEPRGLAQRWLAFRARIAERLAAAAPDEDGAALLVALAIGERYLFQERHWSDFRRTGTSHLVAVSGTHVGLIGLCVFVMLRRLWLRLPPPLGSYDLEVAALASALATVAYAALTGFAVPAQRSLLMIVVALALLVARRRVGALQGIAAALLAVLMFDPFAPLEASFWLSFAAVAALTMLGAPRAPPSSRGRGWRALVHGGRELARLQVAIALALLPLTAAFFGEVPLFGPLVNLAAIPLFNFVLVPFTLLATVLASPPVPLGLEPVVHVAGWLASGTVRALHAVAVLPGAAIPIGSVSPLAAALAALGVVLAMPAHPLPGRRLAWLAIVPALWPAASVPAIGAARITVLDVGHGLAVIVATRTHRLLFDAGPSFPSGFDVGEEVVLPALAAGGRRTLDLLIVSHADNDHAGGAAAVVAAFPRAAVLHGPDVTTLPGRVCARGQRWTWDGVGFAILHPPVDVAARGNDSSCVLRIEAVGGAALLTGDVEARGEAELLAAARRDAAPLAADVVVVAHHGSATSSTPAFVAATHARHAIVSAGYRNRWGFPRAAVSERWRTSGAPVTTTGDSGAVAIDLRSGGVTVRTERDARHHYWEAQAAPVAQP